MDGPERAKEGRPKLEKVRSLLRLLRRLDVVRQPGQPWLGSFGRAPPPCRGQPCDRGCGVWDVELATRTFRESAPVDGVGRVAVPRPVRHLEEAELLCHFGWGHRCRGIAERAKETSDKRAGRKWGQLTGAMPRKWLLSRAREREREREVLVCFPSSLQTHWLTIGHVLLVGKHEEEAVSHLAVVQDFVQLFARLVDPGAVRRVDDKDEALGPGVVVAPEGSDLVLAADVLRARGRGFSFSVGGAVCENEKGGKDKRCLTQTLNLIEDNISVPVGPPGLARSDKRLTLRSCR